MQNTNYKIISQQNNMVLISNLEGTQKIWMTANQNGQPLETPTFKAETYESRAAFRGAVLVKQMRWVNDGRNPQAVAR
jgi:hypothetical protein